MSKVVTIRNVKIGEGVPKIIVPIVEKTRERIVEKALSVKSMRVDAVEWRADFYDDVYDKAKVVETASSLRAVMPDMPLFFTFRTAAEGGEKSISMGEYTSLNKAVAQSGAVDIIDIQIFLSHDVVAENIENIHEAGVFVVTSNHDFSKTPDKDELVARLRKMQDMGADILKIAVMPSCEEDVLTLLAATNEMYVKYAKKPLITMSMSPIGVISRAVGGAFGSSMTFGAVGQTSAPGQIQVEKLSTVLNILHESGGNECKGDR